MLLRVEKDAVAAVSKRLRRIRNAIKLLIAQRRSRRCFKEIEAVRQGVFVALVGATQSPLFQRD